MTAPAPRDQLRREIAEALRAADPYVFGAAHLADALLPIIDEYADAAMARALDDVAEGLDYTPLSERESGQVSDWTRAWHAAAVVLRANARALRDPGRAQAGEQ